MRCCACGRAFFKFSGSINSVAFRVFTLRAPEILQQGKNGGSNKNLILGSDRKGDLSATDRWKEGYLSVEGPLPHWTDRLEIAQDEIAILPRLARSERSTV